jgi:deoxyadenosine/deoxycytidine kinase
MKKYYIAISGNIGSGKTSLAKRLSEKFGWKPFFESVEDNPYLCDFYANMKQWSFHLQIYFLSKRFNDFQNIIREESSVILDRTIYEDAEIFAKNLHDIGNITDRDYQNYRNLYNVLVQYFKPPDLMIYLRSDVDFLFDRIKKRSRNCESDISKEYLEQLNNNYEKWIGDYNLSELLIVNARKIDYVNNENHFDLIVNMIMEKIKF